MDRRCRGKALAFDDVLLVPLKSRIKSRTEPDLTTNLTNHIKISHPLIPTNMDTITGIDMVIALSKTSGAAFLTRFLDYDKVLDNIVEANQNEVYPVCVSVGEKDVDKKFIDKLSNLKRIHGIGSKFLPHVILIDVAHGHNERVRDMIRYIKERLACDVIAGNIATPDAYKYFAEAGADAVRVGIAGGSVCTTRYVTGHGVPTLQSVIDCVEMRESMSEDKRIPIIADGGIKTSGDIVKALAFGADSVCVGSMLAGSSATPGNVITLEDGKQVKEYYGMSSKVAQDRHRGGLRRNIAAEGIDVLVDCQGDTVELIEGILGGVRSGLSYSDAKSIAELRDNFEYYLLGQSSVNTGNNNWRS
jgi:IMP dehydrogenase